ncbi:alanine racemase [Salipaludibacillus sp. CF4.18]|uniref:alanine racemase n=1 Tax=Salipaludibacillus sp. CF4.18 TaxID=3373081 RepID=UPI003EE6CFE3
MVENIDTPALVVDLDKMDNNIRVMSEKARQAGITLRPHIKTHKSVTIALKQLQTGADGITVAKLGEAEVMHQNGIHDIFIAYPIIGAEKLTRLKRLAERADIKVSLDSVEVAGGISTVGASIGKKIKVYIEVDTGLGRVGKKYGEETLRLVEEIAKLPNIEIYGLMTHAGHAYAAKSQEEMIEITRQEGQYLVETKTLINSELGFEIPCISVGSSPTSYIGAHVEGVTEMRPGTYVFNDAKLVDLGLVTEEDCALLIYATVVSRPAENRAIIDSGSKTLTSDKRIFGDGYGLIKGKNGLTVSWLSEEHGVINVPEGVDLKIGDVLEIIPNHVCPTVNLVDELIGIRNGEIEEVIAVTARGKNK